MASAPTFQSQGKKDGNGSLLASPTISLPKASGAGNSGFWLGWGLSVSSITRKTDKGLPKYADADESDTFVLSGAEDLVPTLVRDGNEWTKDVSARLVAGEEFSVQRFRPRIEGLFARIRARRVWAHGRSSRRQSILRHCRSTICVSSATTRSLVEDTPMPIDRRRPPFAKRACSGHNSILAEVALMEYDSRPGIDLGDCDGRRWRTARQ
jgi:hypothetical protein